jgi:hypothetical protein
MNTTFLPLSGECASRATALDENAATATASRAPPALSADERRKIRDKALSPLSPAELFSAVGTFPQSAGGTTK